MSERKARKDTNRPQKTQNTRKKNNYGKGTKLKFGENGPREEVRAERTANRRSVREGTIAAFAAMVIILGGGTAALRHFDRKEIPQTELATRFVDAPDPVLDLELVKLSYAYTTTDETAPERTLLTPGTNKPPQLETVYNALFSHDGLQIASLADRTLKCRADAVKPLNDMLEAFYSETGLRTIIINSAFEPAAAGGGDSEKQCGGCFELGIFIKEDNSRRPFTFEGEYGWFAEHSWEYGFVQRYPAGSETLTGKVSESNFRYVGKAVAQIMHENSLCLEQFEGFMKEHRLDDPLQFGSDSVVYSQPANGEIAVPASQDGSLVPFELYSLGKGKKNVLVIAQPTEQFYSVPKPEADYIVYK